MSEFYNIIKELSNLGVLIASITAIWGVNSWRRDVKWRRKYELAEEVLASFYKAHDSIRIIRSPFGFEGEGESRTKKEGESLEETKIYNQAYVSRERYERNKSTFEKLQSLKFRFIVIYGKEYEQYFNKVSQVINKIFTASDLIAMNKLGIIPFKDGDIKKYTEILYSNPIGTDNIEIEMTDVIFKVEKKCKEIIGKN